MSWKEDPPCAALDKLLTTKTCDHLGLSCDACTAAVGELLWALFGWLWLLGSRV